MHSTHKETFSFRRHFRTSDQPFHPLTKEFNKMKPTSDQLLTKWQRQVACRRNYVHNRHPRSSAAFGYLTCGPVVDDFIEVENLVVTMLFDDASDPLFRKIRLDGYKASRVPWGIQWGGAENNCFCKDLSLAPRYGGRGSVVDLANDKLLRLGLQLDRLAYYVENPKRHCFYLPKLWAGFRAKDALLLVGSGPELERAATRARTSPQKMMNRLCRSYSGLVLYPFDWVSQHWEKTVAVFADLRRYPEKQVFRLNNPADDLCGFQGASQFDFYTTHSVPTAPVTGAVLPIVAGVS
jgi:hypothetical protein